MQNFTRRTLMKGATAITAVAALPSMALAAEDEVAIIRGLIKEQQRLGDIHAEIENILLKVKAGTAEEAQVEQAEVKAENAYIEAYGKVDAYPVQTLQGLAEKIKFSLKPDSDLDESVRLVVVDIRRMADLTMGGA